MKSISPPTVVKANPVAIPTSFFFSAIKDEYLYGPRYSTTCFVDIALGYFLFSATNLATFRKIVAIFLSKFLTPDSLVNLLIISFNALSAIFIFSRP